MSKIREWFDEKWLSIMVVFLIMLMVLLIFPVLGDIIGITHFGIITTKEERVTLYLDRYQTFEKNCLSREYTVDQCIEIWKGQ